MTEPQHIALTLGTAGHVDHGKTALVGALTGKQTDRLAEERRRGLSIELGYAPLSLSALAVEKRLRDTGLQPPLDTELGSMAADLAALRTAGRAVRVGPRLHFHATALDDARRRLLEHLRDGDGTTTVASLRDHLGTSRKYAQALLEHFDGEGLTVRVGDVHRLRRRAASAAGKRRREATPR